MIWLIGNTQLLDFMAYFEEVEQILDSYERFLLEQQRRADDTFSRYRTSAQQRYILNKANELIHARQK